MGFYSNMPAVADAPRRPKTAYRRFSGIGSGLRYYSPNAGRWPSRDPIGEAGGLNLYGFVENDGINAIDRFGLLTWEFTSKDLGQKPVQVEKDEDGSEYHTRGLTTLNMWWTNLKVTGEDECCDTELQGIAHVVYWWSNSNGHSSQAHEIDHSNIYSDYWDKLGDDAMQFDDMGPISCAKANCYKDALFLLTRMWLRFASAAQADYDVRFGNEKYISIRDENSAQGFAVQQKYNEKMVICDGM